VEWDNAPGCNRGKWFNGKVGEKVKTLGTCEAIVPVDRLEVIIFRRRKAN
jgi:hypothetical protein